MHLLSRFSLANRALIALITIFSIVFGVMSAGALKRELIPSLQLPIAAVVTTYPGASPAVVDEQIAQPLGEAVKGVQGLKTVTTTAREGTSTVMVEVEYGTDLDKVQSQLQTAVNRLSSVFPDEAESTVVAGSFDDYPVIQLAVTSNQDAETLARQLDDTAVTTVSRLDGVRTVSVTGARPSRVVVDLDQDELAAAGLTSADVTTALQTSGVRSAGGTVQEDGESLSVQVGERFSDLDDLRDLPVRSTTTAVPSGPTRGTASVTTLGDVATVTSEQVPATGYSRVNGEPAVTLSVTKTPDGNTVAVSHAVRDEIDGIRAQMSGDPHFTVVFDQAPFIEQSIEDLTTEGALGLVMAIIVILVFLLSLRSTLVTAVSIPMSLLVTFIVLRGLDYSLNILTLGALTIAIGRVVDDSIVVIENIKRHLSLGEEKRTAIQTAVKEVASAVTASTVTTVTVFAPIGFVGGQVGELFRPFAVTVTVALLASLLVSLTIIPVLAYWWLSRRRATAAASQDAPAKPGATPLLRRVYTPVLAGALRHPIVTILVAVVVLGGTLALTPLLTTNFIGGSGQNTLTVTQTLPSGSSLADANAAAKKAEATIMDTPGVTTAQVNVGDPGDAATSVFLGTAANKAQFSLTLDEDADAGAVQQDLSDRLDSLDGVGQLDVQQADAGFASQTVDITVNAPDEDSLTTATEQVRAAVEDTPGTSKTTDTLAAAQPLVQVTVDREKAAAAGLDEATLGRTVAALVSPQQQAQMVSGGDTTDVVLRLGPAPDGIRGLRDLQIPTATGVTTLSRVATVERVTVAPSVTRENGERSATVSTTPSGKDLGTLTTDLTSRIDALDLPSGARAEVGGVSADQADAFRQLFIALLAAIAIVYVVMVATFKSLVQPLILLVSVPFAATGSLALLLISDTPLGVPALIGMLMLVGIVVTNAIVLIDLVNQRQRSGMPLREAVLDGAGTRLRPILMTAVATIFALVPMALGLTGGGAFISQPLAIVVIGGLFTSTLLTLVLVPVLYSLVERLRARIDRRHHDHRGAHAAA